MSRAAVALLLVLALACPVFAADDKHADTSRDVAMPKDPFFLAHLRLFVDYDFFALIELFRYYDVVAAARGKEDGK